MNNILFFGTYQYKVDSKGRVSIPAGWKATLNIDSNGYKYTVEYKNNFYKDVESILKIAKLDEISPMLTAYYLDAEGRIIFRTEKNKLAIFKGYGDYFTIEFNAKT